MYCHKTFSEKGNLKVHIRVHTNDRPYPCTYKDICHKSFKTKSQLSDHLLKHTQTKSFYCTECKASFSRKNRLKIHMMIHKGEKPFECIICKKKFREKSNFNYHMKKHAITVEKSLKKDFKEINDITKKNKIFNKNNLITEKNINNFCLTDFQKNSNLKINISSVNNIYQNYMSSNEEDNISIENQSINEEANKNEYNLFKCIDYNLKNNNNKANIKFNKDNIFNNLKNKEIKVRYFEKDMYFHNNKKESKRKEINKSENITDDNALFNSPFYPKENISISEQKELLDFIYYEPNYYKNFDESNSNNNNYDELFIKNEFGLFISDQDINNTGLNNKIEEHCYSQYLNLNYDKTFLKKIPN